MLALVSRSKMICRPPLADSIGGWLFEKKGRAKPVAISTRQAQRSSNSKRCSSFLDRTVRGGVGRRNISELNGIRSRAERRIKWNRIGPATASVPSKNQGVRKLITTWFVVSGDE